MSGFDSGFSGDLGGIGFNQGFSKKLAIKAAGLATPGALYTNIDTYITDGIRAQSSGTAAAGVLGFQGVVVRSNIILDVVLKVTSTVTVQGFKFIRTPEPSGNWLTTSGDNMDAVLTVKSGGSINDGAISTKTFATNSKVRSATRTSPVTVNSYRNEFDIYTVYDANSVTLTAGTYKLSYRAISTQIGVALMWTANAPILTTTSVYPDPADSANTTYYPVMEVLSSAP